MPSMTEAIVAQKINQGIDYIASQVLLSDLESRDSFTTQVGVNRVAIPPTWNFHRNLFAADDSSRALQIVGSIEHLSRLEPDFEDSQNASTVMYLTTSGLNLVYYPVPAEATNIDCGFFRLPTHLENPTDIPTYLPVGLHKKLLENYVCWDVWANVEDGIEGRKVNTAYYLGQFREALVELEDTLEVSQSRKLMCREYSQWI